MPQKQHVMHGRDHLPTGADPIPGLLTGGAAEFVSYILSFDSLQAWYRLGVGDPAGDALDSSGHDLHLTSGIAGDQPPTHEPHPELGADDDQATMFNYAQTDPSAAANSWLQGPTYTPQSSDSGWTMIGFVNPGEVAADPDYVAGVFGPFEGSGSPSGGTMFYYQPATLELTAMWANGVSVVTLDPGVGLNTGQWYLLALVWDNPADTVTMYVNAAEVASDTAAFVAASQHMYVGMGDVGPNNPQFYGLVDEVAVFSEPLSAAQIAGFVTAAAGGSADVVTSLAGGGTPLTGAVTLSAGSNITLTQAAQNIEIAAAAAAPVDDTQAWMPLTTVTGGNPELVWDADDQLIPTLTTI